MGEPTPTRPAGTRGLLKEPRLRRTVKISADALAAALAFGIASHILLQRGPTLTGMAAYLLAAMALNLAFRFPTQHYRAIDIHDARTLVLGTLALMAASTVLGLLGAYGPLGSAVGLEASLITGFIWLAIRLATLALHQRRHATTGRDAVGERTLIIGAGRAGALLCQELREHPQLRCNVLGFVDDDLDKQGLRIQGIPVLGPTELLAVFIREQNASQVILGMPSVRGERLRELTRVVLAQGARIRTVPGILDLVGDRPWKPEVRDVAIEDLLRRDPITLDTEAIRQALDKKVVLITGAGGSIGSELARRVAELRPGRLILLGRGETSLWEVQRQLLRLFPAQNVEMALCDIRNAVRLRQVFQKWRPAVVLHAAAHKHVPFLEANPEEAIENNIFGTRNVIEAARACGTGIMVNVSTDKAVNPVNMLGVSKAIGEILVAQAAAANPGSKFVSVRFGNVLGSRGSVVPVFREQIRCGGPLTITDPGMVRFFMTIPEAAQLVLQAGILGDSGRIYALDMGEPVHILDLAEEMVRLSGFSPGVDMDIQFTGVRPGEKLVEELFTGGKVRRTGVHPKVFEAEERVISPNLLAQGLKVLHHLLLHPPADPIPPMLNCFMDLVPSFQPSPTGLGRRLQPREPTGPVPAPARESLGQEAAF